MTMKTTLPLILFCVFLNAWAQISLKIGMGSIGACRISIEGWLLKRMVTNGYLWMGMSCYMVSLYLWMLILSRVPVGYAYPFVSLSFILTLLGGWFFLNETISFIRVAGIACIMIGVLLVAKSQ
jgi:drug/metabolite transporter (DMT)-like permease